MPGNEQLPPLLQAWLPRQRWFGGKGREIAAIEPELIAEVARNRFWVASVEYADGAREFYQIPLVLHDEPSDNLDHALVGTLVRDEGTVWVYDALHDKQVTGIWLTGIRDELAEGPLRFVRTAEPEAIPVGSPSLVMSGEQSNTSLVFDDKAILKVFRRLQPGINPDVEVQAELTELGATNVARLLGHVTAEIPSIGSQAAAGTTSLAMLQEFMTTATDGWQLATNSVRDLMAEADLHAEEAGGDFAAEAERLGAAVAAVHCDLARAFGTERVAAADWQRRIDVMRGKLDDAVGVVPDLVEVADAARALYDQAADAVGDDGLEVQRIHGDLHLGQVLRTVHRWVLIDFEGEPMAEIESRREFDSPLRDVAGMLRSFDYAGHHRLVEDLNPSPQLAYRAEEWSQRNRAAFCAGYAQGGGADPERFAAVLRAFEVEKAVYEAVYEARNRPSWLSIPLASLRTLATPVAPSGGTE